MLELRRVETGSVPAAPPPPPPEQPVWKSALFFVGSESSCCSAVSSLAGIYVPVFQSQRGRLMSGTDPKGPTLLRCKYVSGGADMLGVPGWRGRCFLSRGRGRGPRTSLARRKDFGGASRRRPLDDWALPLWWGGGLSCREGGGLWPRVDWGKHTGEE